VVDAAFPAYDRQGLIPYSREALRVRWELLDDSAFSAVIAKRVVRLGNGEPPEDAVKLMTFYRCDDRHDVTELLTRLLGIYSAIVLQAQPLRHELLLVDSPVPRRCDAIDSIWFPTAPAALDYVSSAFAYEATVALGGRAFGTERLIARAVAG